MTTSQTTLDYILDQFTASGLAEVTAKKMFGEYGLYLTGKMFALVCDDQLFIKPTEAGQVYYQKSNTNMIMGVPYPNAKPCYSITAEQLEDTSWLAALANCTVQALPLPVKKKNKS